MLTFGVYVFVYGGRTRYEAGSVIFSDHFSKTIFFSLKGLNMFTEKLGK